MADINYRGTVCLNPNCEQPVTTDFDAETVFDGKHSRGRAHKRCLPLVDAVLPPLPWDADRYIDGDERLLPGHLRTPLEQVDPVGVDDETRTAALADEGFGVVLSCPGD